MDVPLHGPGWSVQVPARPAADRDEAVIAAPREVTWQALQTAGLGAWLAFEDGSGGL